MVTTKNNDWNERKTHTPWLRERKHRDTYRTCNMIRSAAWCCFNILNRFLILVCSKLGLDLVITRSLCWDRERLGFTVWLIQGRWDKVGKGEELGCMSVGENWTLGCEVFGGRGGDPKDESVREEHLVRLRSGAQGLREDVGLCSS